MNSICTVWRIIVLLKSDSMLKCSQFYVENIIKRAIYNIYYENTMLNI